MNFELRDYQKHFCREVVVGFSKSRDGVGPFTKQLGVAATGAGKTIIASALIDYWKNKRCMMLADTDELVQQAADKIFASTGIIPDIEKASARASLNSRVVVGSIQTLGRRFERFPNDHFGYLIADEAHLSMSKLWQNVLNYFHEGGAKVLGITATPERGDGQKLLKWYENIAAEIGLFDLINRGHLAPLTVQVCPIEIDCTKITAKEKGIHKGEFEAEEVEESLIPYLERIIEEWTKHASDRQTLVFHPSIKASERFTAMMRERGISAEHVCGVSKNRKEILHRFEKGEFQVLNNANLLTKGYDCPSIRCIINLAPTKSRTQYCQRIGRGTRLHPGKEDCLILDFMWQFKDLGVMRPAALIASVDDQEEEIAEVLKDGKRRKLGEACEEAERERERRVINSLKSAAMMGASGKYDARTLGVVLHQPDLTNYEPRAGWERKPITPGQRRFLEKQGVDTTELSLGHALKISKMLNQRKAAGLCDANQVTQLVLAGVEDAHEFRYHEALNAINENTNCRQN